MEKQLLPHAPDARAFERIVRDDAAFAAGVAYIRARHGVSAAAERFAEGSRPV